MKPKRVRYPTDWSLALGYSPPHFSVTQLPSATCFSASMKGTCTLLTINPHQRTYADILVRYIASKKMRTTPRNKERDANCVCKAIAGNTGNADILSAIMQTRRCGQDVRVPKRCKLCLQSTRWQQR